MRSKKKLTLLSASCVLAICLAACADSRIRVKDGEPGQQDAWVGSSNEAGSMSPDAGGPGASPPSNLDKIGAPLWRPASAHLFSAACGTEADGLAGAQTTIEQILPSHQYYPSNNVFGPGHAPHEVGYADELGAGLQQNGIVAKESFTTAEISSPSCLFIALMLVPDATAPAGSSPESTYGPILDPAAFPLLIDGNLFSDGQLVETSFDSSYPALGELDPPAAPDREAFSHLPLIFYYSDALGAVNPGPHEFQLKVIDATGSGWSVRLAFSVQ